MDPPETPMGKAKQAQQFHNFFQKQSAVIERDIDRLKDISITGGERADAIDHCLASIAKLSGDVKDATTYLPPYDQKTYSEALKQLSATFEATRTAVAPRAKFSFKSGRKNASAVSINDALILDSSGLGMGPPGPPSTSGLSAYSSAEPSVAPTPMTSNPDLRTKFSADAAHDLLPGNRAGVHLSNISNECHVAKATAEDTHSPTAVLSGITHCFIDLTRRSQHDQVMPDSQTSFPQSFASVTLKGISDSWIITGPISGPIHLTNVKRSILFISCRQFRMHESDTTQVHLYSASRPIIEDCHDITFSPLPSVFAATDESQRRGNFLGGFAQEEVEYGKNQWDQVDDFKWLKAGPSPNYQLVRGRIDDEHGGAVQHALKPGTLARLWSLGPSGSKFATFDELEASVR